MDIQPVFPKQIVLGVDGSPDSLGAVNTLAGLPCLPGCQILAVSVVSGGEGRAAGQAEELLRQVQARLQGNCAEVRTAVLEGHPAEVLVRTAAEVSADLVLLGARGKRSAFDFLLGGVASQVVEHAACPVWVQRGPSRPLHTILLALDGSECSQRALSFLTRLPLPQNARVLVVGVAPEAGIPVLNAGPWPVGQELVPMLSDRELEELEQLRKEDANRLKAMLEGAAQQLTAAGAAAAVETRLLEGDPAGTLLRSAGQAQADLIVAGSRGLSAIRGWLLGSVSRRLVQYAPVSVLVVKGPGGCQELSIEDG